MLKISQTILFLFFATANVFSQELICEVSVVAPNTKIKTDPKVFKTLENAIQEFMNNTKWTSEVYTEEEKIQCNIFIGIESQSGENYGGSITVVSKRPVFNSSYESTVINLKDNDVLFSYKEFESIEFAENQFVTNLSHMLAYYAYTIIGYDNETFSENGGEIYLQKALDLTNTISNSDAKIYKGWKSFDKNKRSRYWLITNLLNSRYDLYRKALYKYYRLGLDNFYSDEVLARKNIKSALKELQKVSEDDPNISIMQLWSDTKRKEMIDIFKDAPSEEKDEIVKIIKRVDPVNADRYDVILK